MCFESSGKLGARETKAQTNSGEFPAAKWRPEHRTKYRGGGGNEAERGSDSGVNSCGEGREGKRGSEDGVRLRFVNPQSPCQPWGKGGLCVTRFLTAAVIGSGQRATHDVIQCLGIKGQRFKSCMYSSLSKDTAP